MLGVFVHLIGDAINNIGVIIAAVIIWQTTSPQRFYADPAASTFIAIVIFSIAIPQTKHSGRILLQSAPKGVAMEDVKHDLERVRNSRITYPVTGQILICASTRFLALIPSTSYTYGDSTKKRPSPLRISSSRMSSRWQLSNRKPTSLTIVYTSTAYTLRLYSPRWLQWLLRPLRRLLAQIPPVSALLVEGRGPNQIATSFSAACAKAWRAALKLIPRRRLQSSPTTQRLRD